jgi:hypothetical protein
MILLLIGKGKKPVMGRIHGVHKGIKPGYKEALKNAHWRFLVLP